MKYAVIYGEGSKGFVCAVSSSITAIAKYTRGYKVKFIEINTNTFPIYIIEKNRGYFTFISDHTKLLDEVKSIKQGYEFTIYFINKGFFMHPLNVDQMGILNHSHLTKSEFLRLKNITY